MSTELFFLYDSHCPWSYASLPLVNEIKQHFPQVKINLLHCAHYDGETTTNSRMLGAVKKDSTVTFGDGYYQNLGDEKDSTLVANLMTWLSAKVPDRALTILNKLTELHFQQSIALTKVEELDSVIDEFKLSPPAKVLTNDKLSKNTQANLHDISELQDFIGTNAIPALLFAKDEQLVLLNHHLYLASPKSIVEAINLELDK